METLPVSGHLQELRNRFFIAVFFIVAGSIFGWFIKETILDILLAPFGQTLYYTAPAGGLAFLMKVSVLFGVLVSMPVIYSQFWGFLSPAFPELHRKFVRSIALASTLLFFSGVSFSYFFLVPAALKLFSQFQDVSLAPLISGDAYFSFVATYLLWFGLLFQIPVVFVILGKLGIIKKAFLKKSLPYAFFASFAVAALITPTPDPFNQAMVALPIFMLFLASWVLIKDKKE
jgi:sec-independent protein translocase protein TatC